MRIRELSAYTGVPIATIKFYLRIGLLMPGRLSSRNQAWYSEDHVRRLRLIRVLLDVSGLRLAKLGELLAIVDGREPAIFGAGLPDSLLASSSELDDEDREWARKRVSQLNWHLDEDDSRMSVLMDVLGAYHALGYSDLLENLDDVVTLAVGEPAALDTERAVASLVLGDVLVAVLRRFAQA